MELIYIYTMTEITEDEIYQVKGWLNTIIGDIAAEISLDLDDEDWS